MASGLIWEFMKGYWALKGEEGRPAKVIGLIISGAALLPGVFVRLRQRPQAWFLIWLVESVSLAELTSSASMIIWVRVSIYLCSSLSVILPMLR